MKIAIVLTVKNEERLLRNNLLYHKAIGAEKVFVYFDNTTDKGKESIADLDFVSCATSVPAEEYISLEYLDKFTSQAGEHHTARQCLNTFHALQQCKTLGIDWLISLDADELICIDKEKPTYLHEFFIGLDPKVEVVNFSVLEALQQRLEYKNVFAEEVLFKSVNQYKRPVERIYKHIYNPFTKSNTRFNWWYGQHMGKAALRVTANIIPHTVHRYKRMDGSKPVTVNKGYVLHYHAYDAEDFIKKFTNFKEHPDTFLSGNKIENIKMLLRDVVNKAGYSEAELKDYFKNNLMFQPGEVKQLLNNKVLFFLKRSRPALEEVTSVQKVFNKMET